ncbi:hypothetical protein F1643_02505 [Azospirillum sp. INR13]|uniref:hypothetical protein n=1 Tax=Azospirillum sp. INR13 TaxID=2596919 RepID=UPI0018924271|nr:hypothetical protein [Azospirillum sp. INR13]MBF5093522.1 hypothetical protein [Azospirillum sp. INR13]
MHRLQQQRARHQQRSVRRPAVAADQQAEQMQGIRLGGFQRQDGTVERRRAAGFRAMMQADGLLQDVLDRGHVGTGILERDGCWRNGREDR